MRAAAVASSKSGRFLFARTTEVLTASEFRVPPPCAVAERCGGCDLQHMAPEYQLQWKADVLRDQLTRIGGVADIAGDEFGAAALQAY